MALFELNYEGEKMLEQVGFRNVKCYRTQKTANDQMMGRTGVQKMTENN